MLISLLERSNSPFLLRGDLTIIPLKNVFARVRSLKLWISWKGKEGKGKKRSESEKFLFLFPLPNNISQEALLHHSASELPVSTSLHLSHRTNSTRNLLLLFVVRLWRISRGMNHLFQDINIITLYDLTLTYILINTLFSSFILIFTLYVFREEFIIRGLYL